MVDDQSTKQQPVMLEGACHGFEILPDDNKLYVDVTKPLSVSLILNFNNSVLFFCLPNTSKPQRESEMLSTWCADTPFIMSNWKNSDSDPFFFFQFINDILSYCVQNKACGEIDSVFKK